MKLKELKEGDINTDCREEVGITVGLMDGIIAQVRILRDRDLSSSEITEIFKDMADDEDFDWLYQSMVDAKKQ